MFEITQLAKTFYLHTQQQAEIPVVANVGFVVQPGECVALTGESGSGKSTVLRLIYGNYLAQTGSISVGGTEVVAADPRTILELRRTTLGFVTQFLRVLPLSGGEQQRVNIARGFAYDYPALLLDEPTASLDAANRQTVLDMIEAAKQRGCAIIGIFHDHAAREAVCDREIDVSQFAAA